VKKKAITYQELMKKLELHIECAQPIHPDDARALHLCRHEMAYSIYRLFEKIPNSRKNKITMILKNYIENLLE
jgi:hypothetical protein